MRTDILVSGGIMQIVDDLLQILLGLILTCHIGKLDALCRLDVNLGIGLSHAKRQRTCTARLIRQLFGHILANSDENHQRQHPSQNAE